MKTNRSKIMTAILTAMVLLANLSVTAIADDSNSTASTQKTSTVRIEKTASTLYAESLASPSTFAPKFKTGVYTSTKLANTASNAKPLYLLSSFGNNLKVSYSVNGKIRDNYSVNSVIESGIVGTYSADKSIVGAYDFSNKEIVLLDAVDKLGRQCYIGIDITNIETTGKAVLIVFNEKPTLTSLSGYSKGVIAKEFAYRGDN